MKINSILIANRAEISVRVIKTCKKLGIKSFSVYTSGEEDLPHVTQSDVALCLGEGPLSETYLNISKIIDFCKKYNIDAIHPGYGFLSENAAFCEEVEKNGIIFIGPQKENIILMGDKIGSKRALEKVGTPMIPGYHGDSQDSEFLKEKASEIGFPVLIKATAGGGGKGMRVVEKEADFLELLSMAKSEAKKSFGNDLVLLEKYITRPRHIEVQVFSDTKGNHIHLYERECSIQRRHQKVVEESPSMALTDSLRSDITKSAVEIAKAINYRGAGTVEYILDTDGSFYFLEMNTRLQVEHPVTEMVTGQDLVELQIAVAEGKALPPQETISQNGHAIELRIYAENPESGFLPSVGKISKVLTSGRPLKGRLDSGYVDGNTVTIDFDPMIAKLICHADSRDECITDTLESLAQVAFLGFKTNRHFLAKILDHEKFRSAETYTDFIAIHEDQLITQQILKKEQALAVAAYLYSGRSKDRTFENFRNL